jgi:predicted ATPase
MNFYTRECGSVLIATSNRPPSDLYKNGLNHEYFLPFISQLERLCLVRKIHSDTDHRLLSKRAEDSFFIPVNESTRKILWNLFLSSNGSVQPPISVSIPVMMNRTFVLPHCDGRSCFLSFAEVCETDKGAADFKAIAEHFDVVYLHGKLKIHTHTLYNKLLEIYTGIPIMSVLVHDTARRFITFIDELYDVGTRLIWTSEGEPMDLFKILSPVEIEVKLTISNYYLFYS